MVGSGAGGVFERGGAELGGAKAAMRWRRLTCAVGVYDRGSRGRGRGDGGVHVAASRGVAWQLGGGGMDMDKELLLSSPEDGEGPPGGRRLPRLPERQIIQQFIFSSDQ